MNKRPQGCITKIAFNRSELHLRRRKALKVYACSTELALKWHVVRCINYNQVASTCTPMQRLLHHFARGGTCRMCQCANRRANSQPSTHVGDLPEGVGLEGGGRL